jgi:hypothetical protein
VEEIIEKIKALPLTEPWVNKATVNLIVDLLTKWDLNNAIVVRVMDGHCESLLRGSGLDLSSAYGSATQAFVKEFGFDLWAKVVTMANDHLAEEMKLQGNIPVQ